MRTAARRPRTEDREAKTEERGSFDRLRTLSEVEAPTSAIGLRPSVFGAVVAIALTTIALAQTPRPQPTPPPRTSVRTPVGAPLTPKARPTSPTGPLAAPAIAATHGQTAMTEDREPRTEERGPTSGVGLRPSVFGPPSSAPAATQAATPEDEGHALLAQAERRRGATFPGKDPAFLVLPRPAERNDMSELLTPKVAEMTEQALGYLARAQNADGSWSDTQFSANTGVSALACLAFMAEGSRPKIGKYGKQLDLGLEFILKSVEPSGIIANKGANPPGPMYEHAFSMLALLYAYGDMPHRPQTRDVLARGLQAILRSQHLDGGWRYALSSEGDSDLSVSANVLWVLRTAKKSGFSVQAAAIEKGTKYVEKCAMPDGTFRYRLWGLHGEPNLGGAGIIALCNQGRLDHPLIPPARDRIAYEYRRYSAEDLAGRRYSAYGCFYASIAMYACGDAYFRPWFGKAQAVLEKLQRKEGEFTDEAGNTVYPTAMAAMVLQALRGYLPLYER